MALETPNQLCLFPGGEEPCLPARTPQVVDLQLLEVLLPPFSLLLLPLVVPLALSLLTLTLTPP